MTKRQYQTRVSEDWANDVHEYAAEREISQSEAVRRLIRSGLNRPPQRNFLRRILYLRSGEREHEMHGTATEVLQTRLPNDWANEVDEFAKKRGYNQSQAVRRLVRAGLDELSDSAGRTTTAEIESRVAAFARILILLILSLVALLIVFRYISF